MTEELVYNFLQILISVTNLDFLLWRLLYETEEQICDSILQSVF